MPEVVGSDAVSIQVFLDAPIFAYSDLNKKITQIGPVVIPSNKTIGIVLKNSVNLTTTYKMMVRFSCH